MVNQIGESAGHLWRYLEEHPSSKLEEAAKALNLKESLVTLAAGWLAREDKIIFHPDGKLFRLSLKE